MKNCISLASVCLLILFASASSFAQSASAPPIPQGEQPGNPHQTCPMVTVSCPSDIEQGEAFEFTSSLSGGDQNAKPAYKWEVVGGEIVEGQGTPAIKVNAGIPGRSIIATLRVGGFDPVCATTASCSTRFCIIRPSPLKFDSYGVVSIDNERARLGVFREQLKQNPTLQGYILGYGGRRSHEDEAQKAVERAKNYLVNKLGMNEARIVMVDGGFREERTIELWVMPIGADPPTAQATVDPSEVRFIKSTSRKTAKRQPDQ